MEESDSSDSSENEQLHNMQQDIAAKEDSGRLSPYSDSDTEDSYSKQKSMLNICKPLHVPGKYKECERPESQDQSSPGVFAMECSEQDKRMCEESTDRNIEDSVEVKMKEDCNYDDADFALTGIFEKSMMVIPSMDEDTERTEATVESQKSPSESAIIVDNDLFDQENVDTKSSSIKPKIPPKPAPRKSKSKERYSDKHIQMIDELPEKKQRPLPSPRMDRKTEENCPLFETEQHLEHTKNPKETNEDKSVLKDTSEYDTLEKPNAEDVTDDEEVDTVDIGSAQECTSEDNSIKPDEADTCFENNLEQVAKERMHSPDTDGEEIQLQASTASSSFEVVDDLKSFENKDEEIEKAEMSEDNDSDEDNAANFVNDFKDSDSGKDDVSAKNSSESEPEGAFETPENQSFEKEDEIFYDSTPMQTEDNQSSSQGGDILSVKENTDEVPEIEKETKNSFAEELSKKDTVSVQMKIKTFEDSVVVIGKGTIKEEYESMSSTVCSDDLNNLTTVQDTESKVEFGSIRNRISMFEEKGRDENEDSDRSDLVRTSKSWSSNSSFNVLSREESEDLEMRSDVISTEEIVLEENHDGISDDTEENVETIHIDQDDFGENKEDTLEDDKPPPIAEKSEAVLESMKSMFVDVPDIPDIPPRSLPPEQEMDSFVKIDTETIKNVISSDGLPNAQTDKHDANSDVSEEQNPSYQQQNQIPIYDNMQYQQQQFQQQQQYQPNNPGWNQPYYYPNQDGSYPYQYPFYNPNMNPGMVYPNQNMQYFQQPYFPQQNFGMPYGFSQPDREPYRSCSPENSTASTCDETGPQPQMENLRPDSDDSLKRPQTQNAHHTEVSHEAKRTPKASEAQQSQLTKSKSEDTIKEKKGKASSAAVKRSTSMPSSTPVKRTPGGRKTVEKVRQTHKEIVEEEHVETVKEEDYYIFFKDINPETKLDVLGLFVENYTRGVVDNDDTIFNYSKTCALVTVLLDKKLDLHKVNANKERLGSAQHRPEVFKVQRPTKIAVSSVEHISNTENLDLYFESRKAQGNVALMELKGDTFESDDGSCYVLDFGDADVVKRICDKKGHEVDGKPLRVSPYYECEGGAIWSSRIHVLKIPEPVDVQYDPNYLCILERSCCAQLHDDLKKNHCSLEFKEKVLQLHCMLTPEMTGFKGLAEKWEVSSRSIIDQFISVNIIERPLKSSEHVWNELIEFFNSENMQACEEVVASIDSAAFKIIFIGFSDPVQDKLRQLKEKHTEIEKRLSRRTETIDNLDNLKLKLLEKIGVFEDLKHEREDIKIDIGDGELRIEGQPEDITVVRLKWHDMGNRISRKQWNHGFSKECVFFVNNVLTCKIQSLLEGNNIIAVWKMDAKVFSLYAYEVDEKEMDYEVFDEDEMSSQVCKKAEELLKSAVIEMKEPVEDSIIEVLTSPEWVSFSEHITETFENSAELEAKDSELLIHGMRKETHEVHTRVKDFLDENAILSDTLKTGTVNIRFIREHRQDFVSRLEKRLDKHKVKIELKDESVNIRGNKRGIFEAKKEFKIFFDAIVWEKHTIQKVAVKNVFKDENEHGTIKKIEQETSCLIKIPGENATFVETADIADEEIEDSDGYMIPNFSRGATGPHFSRGATGPHFSRGATGSNQDVFRPAASDLSSPREQGFKAQNGVKVYLVKGELGKQDGNIIVVTTAPNLNLNSGNACKSVLREGGQDLQNECKEKYPNEIKFGEIAVVHGHGALECNFVYLTTLPNWNSEHNPEQIVEKVMKDSLELAEKHNKYSIVFCAMGTGQLQYPTDLVARIMYQAVIDFDKSHPQSSLKEVKFVLYQKDFATIKAFEEEENFRLVGGGERPTFELKTGKITIELLVENIAQQRVDAILCSTSPSMELKRSGACQALVRVGGKTLQDECKSKYGNKLEEGNVVEIGGGNLSCKSVFLTVLPRFNADAINILTKVIQTMLNLAHTKGYKSLALPALGTGFLHYPTNEVCQCMFQTMIDWAKKNPASSVTNIRLIMYAKDHEVIQKFKSYILNEKGKGKREHRRSSGDLKKQGAHQKKLFPSLIPKKEEKALYNAHADGVQIGKIKLNVFKGDILSQKTDAIVSSVGKQFEFIGAVAQILKSKCPEIEQECQKKENIDKLKRDGVVMTKGYQLHVKNVIHVKYVDHIDDWKARILKCVEKANKERLKTIAFPVLGTGKGFKTFSPDAIAGCLFDAVSEFVQKTKSPSIKEIRLIVYSGQSGMYKPIMDQLHKKVQEAVMAASDGLFRKGFKTATKMKDKFFAVLTGKEEGTISEQDMKKFRQEESSLEVHIYSDCKSNIEKCKKELEAKLEESYVKKKIEDYKELIKNIDADEMEQLDTAALADINIDKQAGVITVNGPQKHVAEVIHDLRMRLLKIERRKNDIATAEELYKLVQWQYEEVTDRGFEYTVYEKGLNQKIEEAYKTNAATYEFEDNDGETFVIDFKKLIEYCKSDDTNTVRVVRKDILKAVASALPEDWADMKDNENIKVVSVPNTDKEFQDIEKNFITQVKTGSYAHRLNFNASNLKVSKIERIQNKALYRQYQAKKNQMKEQKPNLPANMPIERDLWHGTKYEAVTSIQMHGFNRSYSGDANGTPWYGEGVYFASDASYSARGWLSGANLGPGSKGYMFLVKALTGQLYPGTKGMKMRYLPPVDSKNPTILYDCVVDDIKNPLEFVIFNDTQAYPAYIITFTT
ncbi:protein mono-ADP-ribosyltransferase PARP14-like [Ruditapes philippinarum]|uniref:protein mono-ADP-ribosyltransferase PARP14-like n=1 Tax=Ruditapes philippinarum TaxID=129788 RepID=UPI00295BAB1A|nr:protein mono-ADP-ribosyltransferase PARP14-like [Ruditapes philippinarum]